MGVVRAVLAPHGLRGAAEMHTSRAWRSPVRGYASLEITGGFGLPPVMRRSIAGFRGEARGGDPRAPTARWRR